MATELLTSGQALALLDILSHHEVYAEIEDFKAPGTLSQYGPPFRIEAEEPSTSPSLQSLLSKFVLTLPGLKDAPNTFWQRDLHEIIEQFEKAELSESYDKGVIGIRKTLATAVSALIEYPVRGVYAGFQRPKPEDEDRQFDLSNPADLSQAFIDAMHFAVYGGVIEEVFKTTAATDKLSDHKPIVQAAHEYGLVNVASFMHYALIISPKGQSLLTLIDNANKLIPYLIIKQTLKIGNVASMINGMMKVVLAKVSLTSVTNWMGLTQNPDDGMNLLEQIISTVLNYEIRDLKSRASKIEKEVNSPSKEQLSAIKGYLQKSREEHEAMRQYSQASSHSIVSVILHQAMVPTEMTNIQHHNLQEYLSVQLSIRDREQIIKVLCHSQPDHLTQAIKDVVAAYEPVIRHVHNAVDLSAALGDFESFVKDTIKLSKVPTKSIFSHSLASDKLLHHHSLHLHHDKSVPRDAETDSMTAAAAPTVGDFVALLQKHQHSLHRFLHQCAKNGKELTAWFYDYATAAASQFRRDPSPSNENIDTFSHGSAGSLTAPLNDLFSELSAAQRTAILPILDAHAIYLSSLHAASAARLSSVIASPPSSHFSKIHHSATWSPGSPAAAVAAAVSSSRPSSKPPSRVASRAPSPAPSSSSAPAPVPAPTSAAAAAPRAGPGAYLARWQALLDAAVLTPATETGPVRHGGRRDEQAESGPDAEGAPLDAVRSQESVSSAPGAVEGAREEGAVKAPDATVVVEALGVKFRALLAERSREW